MPIYDSDGTTNREIAYVYDNDGSTNRQIKEVYDNDGSTNRLVYSAQSPSSPYILARSDQCSSITGGWNISSNLYAYQEGFNSGTVSTNTNSLSNGWMMSYSGNNKDGNGWMFTQNPVAISGWNKIVLYFGWMTGYGDAERGRGHVMLKVSSNRPVIDGDNYLSASGTIVSLSRGLGVDSTGNQNEYIIGNISGKSGSYYVSIQRSNGVDYKTFTTCFYDVYFEM